MDASSEPIIAPQPCSGAANCEVTDRSPFPAYCSTYSVMAAHENDHQSSRPSRLGRSVRSAFKCSISGRTEIGFVERRRHSKNPDASRAALPSNRVHSERQRVELESEVDAVAQVAQNPAGPAANRSAPQRARDPQATSGRGHRQRHRPRCVRSGRHRRQASPVLSVHSRKPPL
jgi:hypothetical protein